MTNASCADCGRIVAFRTHDPSEIAECRNCGTWVKRSAEMPGVAVSVKQDGPVARKTALPPRKDESKSSTPNPQVNTTRSAAPRPEEKSSSSGDALSAAAVYSAIRDLQKSVHDLRAGQRKIEAGQKTIETSHRNFEAGQQSIQAEQKALHDGQKALHEGQKSLHSGHSILRNGQKALHDGLTVLHNGQGSLRKGQRTLSNGQKALYSGQKQLFGQYRELQKDQEALLERTLPLTEMPSPAENGYQSSRSTLLGPLSSFDRPVPGDDGFFTTPFSSLKIPLIPIELADLGLRTSIH